MAESNNNVPLDESEEVVRLLFSTRMVNPVGILGKEAFPVDELIERDNKSVSVDVKSEIDVPEHIIEKLTMYENPERDRLSWGYATAVCGDVTSITSQDGEQVYAVLRDPITYNSPPYPWDPAHAKIIRAKSEFTKGFIRGYRDHLSELFQANVVAT